ncbi:four helix bundle protein [soil metagenome]
MKEVPVTGNPVREKSYVFALEIVRLQGELLSKREYVLSRQLVRAGTSIGANVEEAAAAQSRKDFAAKMAIASKEAREAHYWLRLLRDAEMFDGDRAEVLLEQCEELIRLLTAIVKTVQQTPAVDPLPLPGR